MVAVYLAFGSSASAGGDDHCFDTACAPGDAAGFAAADVAADVAATGGVVGFAGGALGADWHAAPSEATRPRAIKDLRFILNGAIDDAPSPPWGQLLVGPPREMPLQAERP